MKKSFFLKILTGNIIIILIFSILSGLFLIDTVDDFYIDILRKDLFKIASSMECEISKLVDTGNKDDLDSFVKKNGKKTGVRITVITKDGVVLADSKHNPLTMENHKKRAEIKTAYSGKPGYSIRYSVTMGKRMLYLAIPVYKGDRLSYILRVSLFVNDVNKFFNNIKFKILEIIFILLLFSIIISVFFSRGLSKPIEELAEQITNFSEGDFEGRVIYFGNDEIGELAKSFNEMGEKLKKVFLELTTERERLSTVINSISEGLVVFDSRGNITSYNSSFENITGCVNCKNREINEIINNKDFERFLDEIKQICKPVVKEIDFNNRTIMLSGNIIIPSNNIVVLISDLTGLKQFDLLKKDFVTNVSHELRTPLTAIKGFLETIEIDSNDPNQPFIEIIKRHVERLINIVNDLLTLSELEGEEEKIIKDEINLKNLIDEVVLLFKDKADKKGVEILTDISEKISFKGDSFKLSQALVNLVDNAIKYTDNGFVKISSYDIGDEISIIVEDTGIGIPQDKIDRIFERFYRVDKSRSRRSGGTGLGLSIVKHIVLLHNGRLVVESDYKKGSKFTVILPLL